MTPLAASIERARGNLRALLNSASADHNRIGYLVGIIVGLRICAAEIGVKLKKPSAAKLKLFIGNQNGSRRQA